MLPNLFKKKLAIPDKGAQSLTKTESQEAVPPAVNDTSDVSASTPKLAVRFKPKTTGEATVDTVENSNAIAKVDDIAATGSSTPAPVVEPVKAKKGFFSKKEKKSIESTVKEAPAKVSKKKQSVSAGHKKGLITRAVNQLKLSTLIRPDVLTVLTEADSIGAIGWQVGPDSISEIPVENSESLLSFSHLDRRFSVESDIKNSEAQNLVLSENGDSYFINYASTLEALYGTTVSRLNQYNKPLCPALMLIEQTLKEKLEEKAHCIIGVNLQDVNTKTQLVVYYHYGKNGDISDPEIVINPSNLNFLLSSFATKHKTTLAECEVYFLDNVALLQAVDKYWHGYPQEPEFHGLSIRKLFATAALGAMAGAGASATYAGQAYYSKVSHQNQENEWKKQTEEFNLKTNEILMANVVPFSKTQELPLELAFKDAHALWSDNVKITMNVTPERRVYEIITPLVKEQMVSDKEKLKQLLNITPPEGCMQDSVLLTGALNDVKIKIQCEIPAGPLSSYRVS